MRKEKGWMEGWKGYGDLLFRPQEQVCPDWLRFLRVPLLAEGSCAFFLYFQPLNIKNNKSQIIKNNKLKFKKQWPTNKQIFKQKYGKQNSQPSS